MKSLINLAFAVIISLPFSANAQLSNLFKDIKKAIQTVENESAQKNDPDWAKIRSVFQKYDADGVWSQKCFDDSVRGNTTNYVRIWAEVPSVQFYKDGLMENHQPQVIDADSIDENTFSYLREDFDKQNPTRQDVPVSVTQVSMKKEGRNILKVMSFKQKNTSTGIISEYVKDGFDISTGVEMPRYYNCTSDEIIADYKREKQRKIEVENKKIADSKYKPKNSKELEFEKAVQFLFGEDWGIENYEECKISSIKNKSSIELSKLDASKAIVKVDTDEVVLAAFQMPPIYVFAFTAPASHGAQTYNGKTANDFYAIVGAPSGQNSFGTGMLCGALGRGTCGKNADQNRIVNAIKFIYSKHCKFEKSAY